MEKKKLKMGYLPKKPKLPENIREFLNRDETRSDQKRSANKVNGWLYKLYKRGIIGGTAIGKYYSSLVLDVTYQGSEIYISLDGEISIVGTPVNNINDFKNKLEKYIDFVQD